MLDWFKVYGKCINKKYVLHPFMIDRPGENIVFDLYDLFLMDLGQNQQQRPAVHTGEGLLLWTLALMTCDR